MESMKELFSIINQVAQSTAHSQTLFNWTQTNPLCLLHKKKYYTKFFSTYGIRPHNVQEIALALGTPQTPKIDYDNFQIKAQIRAITGKGVSEAGSSRKSKNKPISISSDNSSSSSEKEMSDEDEELIFESDEVNSSKKMEVDDIYTGNAEQITTEIDNENMRRDNGKRSNKSLGQEEEKDLMVSNCCPSTQSTAISSQENTQEDIPQFIRIIHHLSTLHQFNHNLTIHQPIINPQDQLLLHYYNNLGVNINNAEVIKEYIEEHKEEIENRRISIEEIIKNHLNSGIDNEEEKWERMENKSVKEIIYETERERVDVDHILDNILIEPAIPVPTKIENNLGRERNIQSNKHPKRSKKHRKRCHRCQKQKKNLTEENNTRNIEAMEVPIYNRMTRKQIADFLTQLANRFGKTEEYVKELYVECAENLEHVSQLLYSYQGIQFTLVNLDL